MHIYQGPHPPIDHRCMEYHYTWDDLVYITKDMIHDVYNIVGLCSGDYSYIIMI